MVGTPGSKRNVIGVLVDATDYETATDSVIAAARESRGAAVSALAVHGVMTGVLDPVHRHRLNSFDLIVPDGQPVRWALNVLHRANLRDRVYGPTLMLEICRRAADEALPIYLYGSRQEVLDALRANLQRSFTRLEIAGSEPSRFRTVAPNENDAIIARIRASGARVVFVGLGCPRQEVWAFENRSRLGMPAIAVGAAFDFHAGLLPQAPPRLQRLGLEWAFRLFQEPRRLWRRYAYLNPAFVGLFLLQFFGLRQFDPADTAAPSEDVLYA